MMATTRQELTTQERERRAKSIAGIRHSQRMEGGDVSPFAAELFERYIGGELTLQEVGAQLRAHHNLPTA